MICVIAAVLAAAGVLAAPADTLCTVSASAVCNASTGDFAPYFIGSNNYGRTVQSSGAYLDVKAERRLDTSKRVSWGAGAEIITGASHANEYMRYSLADKMWGSHRVGYSPVWIQQLYAELKHRSIYVTLGQKEEVSALVNHELSSGDFVHSGNARPIPQLRGELKFSDIPFTQGWVQINCVLTYGKMTDDGFLDNLYNYYNYHLASGAFYTYKRVYFRTNPDKPVWVTAGAQTGSLFGGKSVFYKDGDVDFRYTYSGSFKSFVNMLFPVFIKSESFVEGSTLGSWDFRVSARTRRAILSAYFQWPFEDGSGIAKRNGWDGIWGVEVEVPGRNFVTGAVLEYLDFRNQSGPVHYAAGDFLNPTLQSSASGRDNYYNNAFYNSYANYGMSIGTPFLMSPIYNLDGFPGFSANRANGVHAGLKGYLAGDLRYRALFGYRRALGTYDRPYVRPRTSTSFMLEGVYDLSDRLSMKAMFEYDGGDLQGDNFGALFSLTYKCGIAR